MIIRFALSICATLLAVSLAWAQCNCGGDCVQGICPQPTGYCGSGNDWQDNFFNCCKLKQFDGPICDPCCRLPYFSFFSGYSSLGDIDCVSEFSDPSVINIIDDGTTIIDPGPPNVILSDFLAETIDVDTVQERGFIFDEGYSIGGAIGYRVHRVARVEAEFSYRENDVSARFFDETITTTRTFFDNPLLTGGNVVDRTVTRNRTEAPATGGVRSYSGLFNAYYDFSSPRIRCFNLYLGGGLGLSYFKGDIQSGGELYRTSSTSFAYQMICGINVPLTQHFELFGEYRFLGASRITVDNLTTNISLGQSDPLVTHNAFFGVRWYPGKFR